MGNMISMLSLLEFAGFTILAKWTVKFSSVATSRIELSVSTLQSQIGLYVNIASRHVMSYLIPVSVGLLFCLRSRNKYRERIGYGLSMVGLSLFNIYCYTRVNGGAVSHDAYILNTIIGLSGVRIAAHNAYWLYTSESCYNGQYLDDTFTNHNSGTIVISRAYSTNSSSSTDNNSYSGEHNTKLIIRAIECILRSLYLGVSNLMPFLCLLYSGVDRPASLAAACSFLLLTTGVVVEGVAEWQKEAHMLDNPDIVCSSGLYSYWRYPESTGKILTHMGILASCYFIYNWKPSLMAGVPHLLAILGVFTAVRQRDNVLQRTQMYSTFYMNYRARTYALLPKLL